jgi:hypothetical protein
MVTQRSSRSFLLSDLVLSRSYLPSVWRMIDDGGGGSFLSA